MAAMLRDDLGSSLLSYGKIIHKVTQTDPRNKFWEFLANFDHHDEFYTLVDLKQQRIVKHLGIQKWTGYEANEKVDLPADYITSHVHPFFRPWYQALVTAATMVFAKTEMNTKALHPRFVVNVPIEMANGQFFLVKIMGMPFFYDEDRQLATVMYSYTIVLPYKEEPVTLGVYGGPGIKEETIVGIRKQIQTELQSYLLDVNMLSDMQMRIAGVIRQLREKKTKIANASIAARLMGKRNQPEKIDNVKRAAILFKKRLLDLMNPPRRQAATTPAFLIDATPLHVIEFFEDCGIIAVLEGYIETRRNQRGARH